MEHTLELISPILEIFGNLIFHICSYPGNIGKHIFLISHILEILDRTIHTQSYPGNTGSYDPYSVLSWVVRSFGSTSAE